MWRDGRANVPVEKGLIVEGEFVLLDTFAVREGLCDNVLIVAVNPVRQGREYGLGMGFLRAPIVILSRHSGSLSASCLAAVCFVSFDAVRIRSSRRRRRVCSKEESVTDGQISDARTAILCETLAGIR